MLSNAKYEQMDLWDRKQLDHDLQARIEEKTDFDEAYEYLWKRYIQKTTSKDLSGTDKYCSTYTSHFIILKSTFFRRGDFMFMTGLALDKDDRLKKQTDDIIASFKDMPGITKKSNTAKKWGAAAAKAKEGDGGDAVFTRKSAAELIAGSTEGKTSLAQVFTMKTIAKKWTKSSLKGKEENKPANPEALISNAMEAAKAQQPLHGNTLNLPNPDGKPKKKKEKKKYNKVDTKRHSTVGAFGTNDDLAPDDGSLGVMSNKNWRRHSFKRPSSARDPDSAGAFERRSFRKTKKSYS